MGSTTSKSATVKGETELAYGGREARLPSAPTPAPTFLEWTIADNAGVTLALHPLVRGFVDMFCEVDPKAHTTFSELASAMFVDLENNGVHVSHINVNTVHCVVSLVCAAEPMVRLAGVATPHRPFEFLVLKGIRVKSFPEPSSAPIHMRLHVSTWKLERAYDSIARMLMGGVP